MHLIKKTSLTFGLTDIPNREVLGQYLRLFAVLYCGKGNHKNCFLGCLYNAFKNKPTATLFQYFRFRKQGVFQ
jgi:hypothetical protein